MGLEENSSDKEVNILVRLLKLVQKDLYELNVSPEKCLEIWSIGVMTYRAYVAGMNTVENPAMIIPCNRSTEGGKNETGK
jgi:predicted RNA methylase